MRRENDCTKRKILSPKNDVVFKKLFGEVGSERITKRFLENLLDRRIDVIRLGKSTVLTEEKINDKIGVLDVFIEIEAGEKCDIEMQMTNQVNLIERLLFYWSKIYLREFKEGDEYKKLKKTIVILIANFKIKGLEELEYITN